MTVTRGDAAAESPGHVLPRPSLKTVLVGLGAGAVAGLGWWATRGALDLFTRDGRAVRVAMLPSLAEAAVLMAISALFVAGVVVAFARWPVMSSPPRTRSGTSADLALPLLLACLAVLPYLPHLADAWPAIVVLAGPLKYLFWTVTAVLLVRAIVVTRLWPRTRFGLSPRVAAVLVFALSLLVFTGTAGMMIGRGLFPGGDEPHYLVIAQSLWRDGDLRIENNHQRGDTYEYYASELKPHYLTRGRDGEIYSVHPVGLPVAAAPVYALAGYRGVAFAIAVAAAGACASLWWVAWRATGSAGAATFSWLSCGLSAPFVFNSFTVYPEVPAALMAVLAYGLAVSPGFARREWHWALPAGLAVATLPWLSTKYVPMAAVLGAIAVLRLWFPARDNGYPDAERRNRSWLPASAALMVPNLLSLALWLGFFHAIWGTPHPSAPYGGQRAMSLPYLLAGGPGLLLDQEYGILAVAPALWLAFSGLGWMMRERSTRRSALETGAAFTTLLVTVGAFHIWWGGSGVIGRPVIAGLPLLGVPIAWRFHTSRDAPARRAAYIALAVVGLGIVATLATVSGGLLLATERDGSSRLLDWWSPSWNLASIAPTFIASPPTIALGIAGVWIICALGAGLALRLVPRSAGHGTAAAAALLAGAVGLGAVTIAIPVLFRAYLPPPLDLEARVRLPMLDRFSPSRQPLAIRYEPFDLVRPAAVPRLFRLVARPDDNRPRPPAPLLHNARWSLPAGRYEVQLTSDAPANGRLDLQLGRLGPPVKEWPVELNPPRPWQSVFALPIDVGFVGVIASRDVESARPTVMLRPIDAMDLQGRLPPQEVLQTVHFAHGIVFFHDERIVMESEAFWTRSGAPTSFTVAPATHADAPARPALRVSAGPVKTSVRVRVVTTDHAFDLEPHEARELRLPEDVAPKDDAAAWRIELEATSREIDGRTDPTAAASTRGCRVELIP